MNHRSVAYATNAPSTMGNKSSKGGKNGGSCLGSKAKKGKKDKKQQPSRSDSVEEGFEPLSDRGPRTSFAMEAATGGGLSPEDMAREAALAVQSVMREQSDRDKAEAKRSRASVAEDDGSWHLWYVHA